MDLYFVRDGDWIISTITSIKVYAYEIVDKNRKILRGEDGHSFYGNVSNPVYLGPKSEVDRLVRLIKICYRIRARVRVFNAQAVSFALCKEAAELIAAQRKKEYEDGLHRPGKEEGHKE